jgi:hypothetical protein
MSRSKGVANNGCPDESEAVMMKLNEYTALSCLTRAKLKKTNLTNN